MSPATRQIAKNLHEAPPYRPDPRLPAHPVAPLHRLLPLLPFLLPVHLRGGRAIWVGPWIVDGDAPGPPLPPLGQGGLRSGPVIATHRTGGSRLDSPGVAS